MHPVRLCAALLIWGCRAGSPPLIVGIGGGSGCGKTTLAHKIVDLVPDVSIVSTDAYYRTLSEEDHLKAIKGDVNFDRPEALDLERLVEDVRRMRGNASWPLQIPSYDFVTHRSSAAGTSLEWSQAVILEGLFVLAVPELRELLDVRLFARDDVDVCLVQRLRRDSRERGIPLDTALVQYEQHVKPAYDTVVQPSAVHADLVIPTATRNDRAAELVAGWILNRAATSESTRRGRGLRDAQVNVSSCDALHAKAVDSAAVVGDDALSL